jgi:hypothetical protein
MSMSVTKLRGQEVYYVSENAGISGNITVRIEEIDGRTRCPRCDWVADCDHIEAIRSTTFHDKPTPTNITGDRIAPSDYCCDVCDGWFDHQDVTPNPFEEEGLVCWDCIDKAVQIVKSLQE